MKGGKIDNFFFGGGGGGGGGGRGGRQNYTGEAIPKPKHMQYPQMCMASFNKRTDCCFAMKGKH